MKLVTKAYCDAQVKHFKNMQVYLNYPCICMSGAGTLAGFFIGSKPIFLVNAICLVANVLSLFFNQHLVRRFENLGKIVEHFEKNNLE